MRIRRPRQLVTAALTALVLLAVVLPVGGCRPQSEPAVDADATSVEGQFAEDQSAEDQPATPRWAVSPLDVGSDRPPLGRSLFDFVMSAEHDGRRVHDLPFPFSDLLQRLRERAGCGSHPDCLRVVMIPLGRSLQRLSASPEFFYHPRVVVAVTGAGDTVAPLLKDRLYLGYQEATGVLEVISYNEAAGRFEFQLVHDYRAGGTPRVSYARRSVCTACHQNVAPIFSRQPWLETNANPDVAARLAARGERLYGIAVDTGLGTPNAIDDATDRANLLAVWQRLWRDGCGDDDAAGRRCRAAAVLAALQYRLSGGRGFDRAAPSWREDFLPVFTRQWQARWPGGLAIPNPDLPNRDPLPDTLAAPPSGASLAHVPARFEPLQPRAPLQVWTLAEPDDAVARRFVAGLGGFFIDADMQLIDRRLAALVDTSSQQSILTLPCRLHWTASELRFDCGPDGAAAMTSPQLGGTLALANADAGGIDVVALAGAPPLHHLRIGELRLERGQARFVPLAGDLRARLPTGEAIARIELHWSPASIRSVDGQRRNDDARAVIQIVDDLAPLRAAIEALAGREDAASPLRSQIFARSGVLAALLPHLGIAERPRCCLDASVFAAARVEPDPPPAPTAGSAARFAELFVQCAACHATGETSPPNFLHGPSSQVEASLRHCAPRIYARLSMWQRPVAQREKTPMPPPLASAHRQRFEPPEQLDALLAIASDLLREETGREPSLDALLEDGYETMRPCLPPPTPPHALAGRNG